MSSGAGHILDMISRMKSNRALRKKRSFKDKKGNWKTTYTKKLNFKKATKKELEAVRTKMQLQKKQESKKKILVLFITLAATALTIFIILFFAEFYFY